MFLCLDPDEYVKKNVATLIREIAKHTPEVWFYDKLLHCIYYILCSYALTTFTSLSVRK